MFKVTASLKMLLRELSCNGGVFVSESEFESFFNSRVWMNLKHEVARRLDETLNVIYEGEDARAIERAKGAAAALQFILGSENQLAALIVDCERDSKYVKTEGLVRELLRLASCELDGEGSEQKGDRDG